jgi:hypothetical protein
METPLRLQDTHLANFPTSLDNFTNPISTDNLNNPSHFLQHADANDAIEAVEAKIGIGTATAASATSGQVLMARTGGTSVWANVGTVTNGLVSGGTVTGAFISGGTASNPMFVAPEETVNIVATASSGTVNTDFLTAGVTFATANATANWVVNIRGNSGTTLDSLLTVGQAISHTYLNTNGGTAYYPTAFRIDGTAVTPRWQAAGTPSSGNTNSVDAYAFTVIKTATTPTYTVLASQTRFA